MAAETREASRPACAHRKRFARAKVELPEARARREELSAVMLGRDGCTVLLDGSERVGADVDEVGPLAGLLIVDENLRLVEEGDKAMLDAEFLGDGTGMVFAAGAPAVELRALLMQLADVVDDPGDGLFPAARGLVHKSIIHVDVDEERIGHGFHRIESEELHGRAGEGKSKSGARSELPS